MKPDAEFSRVEVYYPILLLNLSTKNIHIMINGKYYYIIYFYI